MLDFSLKEVLIALFSGLGTALITGYVCKRKYSVTQRGNKVGGDLAGRDINKS
jgi:hypothetical protein